MWFNLTWETMWKDWIGINDGTHVASMTDSSAAHAFNKVSFSTLLQAFLDDEIHDSRAHVHVPPEHTCVRITRVSNMLKSWTSLNHPMSNARC